MISESNRQLLQHIQLLMTATTQSSSNQRTNATIVYNETLVVSPICHIASLEVYRGINDVTRISHDGFSLSISGMIEASIKLFNRGINCGSYLDSYRLIIPAWHMVLRNTLVSCIV